MSQQAALPFKNHSRLDFDTWLGQKALSEVLKNYSELPQFTYLVGQNHSGKTHLLNAMHLHMEGREKDRSQLLFNAASLLQVDMTAIVPAEVKYVLIDDINDVACKPQGELALFNFFNYCKNSQIKLVVSSNIEAQNEQWQLPDLVSRLKSGLTIKIETLRGEVAFECLAQQFDLNGIPVEPSVMQYLKTHYSSSYPKLYQLFMSLAAESLEQKRKVTVPLVKTVVASLNTKDSLN